MELIRPTVVLVGILVLFLAVKTAISLGWKHRQSKFIRVFGSLHLAVTLIASLATLLGITTFLESSHGTEYVVRTIYRSRWFEMILIGIWLNIFSATILRFPFPWKKIGFVLTHIGILTLLIGSLMTRLTGIEGTITLSEGNSSHSLALQGNALRIQSSSDIVAEVPVDAPGKVSLHKDLDQEGNLKVEVMEYHPHSELGHQYVENPDSKSKPTPAIHFEVRSSMFQIDKWLSMRNEDLHRPDRVTVGPAKISLKQISSKEELENYFKEPDEKKAESIPVARISLDEGKTFHQYNVKEVLGKKFTIPDSEIEITITGFFDNATVSENFKIVEHPSPGFNPAITFEVMNNFKHPGHDAEGHEHHPHTSVRFQVHPEYQGSHKSEFKEPMILLEGVEAPQTASGELLFLAMPDGKFYYRIKSSKGQESGPVELNKMVKMGWNDAILVVREALKSAEVKRHINPVTMKPNQKTSLPFVKVRLYNQKDTTEPKIFLYGEQSQLFFAERQFNLTFGERSLELPFEVTLKDFRKIDYPNTSRAMSYESDVKVNNLDGIQTGVSSLSTTISMNNVLDYRGWRFFQASFRIEGDTEYSTFQVAKDPGIETIYLGSIIMVLGISLMFWWKPDGRR